jgi:osmotically-inducible protein OsmY
MSRKFAKSTALLVVLTVGVAMLPLGASAQAKRGGGRYDAEILAEVTKELKEHDRFRNVRASVEDGIVTLEGTVERYRDKLDADRAAHGVKHAAGVRNQIVVKGEEISDTALREKLADKLRYDRIDRGIMFNNFQLQVNDGVVTISGQARTESDKASALAIVENTPGVKEVIDKIEVLPASFHDDDIRIRTARAIYGHPAMQKYALDPQAPIRIVVEHGKVTLYGVVNSQMDKQIAEIQARSVAGSFSVENRLMVAGEGAK